MKIKATIGAALAALSLASCDDGSTTDTPSYLRPILQNGSIQTVYLATWACPYKAPGTPVRGTVDRFYTEKAEGRCFDLKVGNTVQIKDIGYAPQSGSNVVCVIPVGSIKPCAWTAESTLRDVWREDDTPLATSPPADG